MPCFEISISMIINKWNVFKRNILKGKSQEEKPPQLTPPPNTHTIMFFSHNGALKQCTVYIASYAYSYYLHVK